MRMFFKESIYYIVLIAIFCSCSKSSDIQRHDSLFTLLSPEETRVTFKNNVQNTKELNILNYLYFYNGAGLAIGDFNNDSLPDIYFTSNQSSDKLYLNKGSMSFEDITDKASINNNDGWTTGVTTVDINQDGLLDIYVCKLNNHLGLKGHNLLFINQGTDSENVPYFKELSKQYGLDFSGYSTQSIFLDYDLDGDLDMYLLNHSLYPNNNYGKGRKRLHFDSMAGDRLFRNENNLYKDISKEVNIYQGTIGYGLGISASDINNDGYPDLYIGNDFFENDYLYVNQQGKSFLDINNQDKALGHTSHFSMGNAIVDINNDLKPDIISVDMLPEDVITLKSTASEYNYPIYHYYLQHGYNHQFMQNTLHINNGNNSFIETAHLSGIAATGWSWSPLVADFDNDGYKDIYITNGIKGVTNNMDFINFISNEKIQRKLGANMSEESLKFIEELPEEKIPNYFFKNINGLTFKNVTEKWTQKRNSFSNGAVYADLDNDGDLDIVVNEVDNYASIYKNNSVEKNKSNNNFIKVSFKGNENNKNGIGAKVIVYSGNTVSFAENYSTTGYLSARESNLHFGLGKATTIDSLKIIWPTKEFQTIENLAVNKKLVLHLKNAKGDYYTSQKRGEEELFKRKLAPIKYLHKDQKTIDFNRDPLLPYSLSNQGPDIEIGDLNNDSLQDILITGAKGQPSEVWLQKSNLKFEKISSEVLEKHAISDDTSIKLVDVNNDGVKEIIIASGGNEFVKGQALKPRLYYYNHGKLTHDSIQFQEVETNASNVSALDIDNDGDMDICITSNAKPHHFGESPEQYIFKNNGKGNFKEISDQISKDFKSIGNVYDIVWKDLDNNGFKDAILVGHWMPISIFMSNGKDLTLAQENGLKDTSGWWNTVIVEDFDKDGDMDIMAGNFGNNTRLRATKEEPIQLYRYDFDTNDTKETVVTYFYKGKETIITTKDELAKQLPMINKRFLYYKDFAEASVEELFGIEKLKKAYQKKVSVLESCYFENLGDNKFKTHKLPLETQVSSINHIGLYDLNSDGYKDVILNGNNFEISTQLGRLDALRGIMLMNDKNGFFNVRKLSSLNIFGQVRDAETFEYGKDTLLIIGRNKDSIVFLKKKQ